MGYTSANISSISKLDFWNNVLTVTYKSGNKEVYDRVYANLWGSDLEFRSIIADEREFVIKMDVNYDPWEGYRKVNHD